MTDFIKPNRPVDRVFLHCSASSNKRHGNVEIIRQWHKQRGWSDIGYHYFIPFEGKIQIGRDIEKTPAAQQGHNTGTIAICLHGLKKTDFTYDQFEALRNFCTQINNAYDNITFHGHCEVSAKACPVFDYKAQLGLTPAGRMISTPRPKVLELFDTGGYVVELQRDINAFLAKYEMSVVVDGIFGQQTLQAVILFQRENGLDTDGIVGSKTRLILPSHK